MSIVITDAYSSSNTGDAELVDQTIRVVQTKYSSNLTVLATQPASFDSLQNDRVAFVEKPLGRLGWRRRRGMRRAGWLLREATGVFAMWLVAHLPGRRLRLVISALARSISPPWYRVISSATRVVGVGGGYLGDRYLRESLVTAITYRFAASIGVAVETMPLSISSARNFLLRSALRATSEVTWRCREATSLETLRELGITADLVPDLAWLNEASDRQDDRVGIAVAPVGSKFYAESSEEPKIWKTLKPALDALPYGGIVRLIPMHRWAAELGDGGDDEACEVLSGLIAEQRPDVAIEMVAPSSYADVRGVMAVSEYAICERLHAALAALTTGTPTFVVAYEPKHQGVLKLAGLESLLTSIAPPPPVESSAIREAASTQRDWAWRGVVG